MKKSSVYIFGFLFSVTLVSCSYKAESDAVKSIKKIGERVYYMNYEGDYCLDTYLEKGGVKNVQELTAFISSSLKTGKWTSPKKTTASDLKIVPCDFGCSSITVKNSENPAGFLFGRNYDWKDCAVLIVHTKPDNGYESVSTCCLSHLGFDENWEPKGKFFSDIQALALIYVPMDGMNEKGLYIADLMAGDAETTAQERGNISVTTTDAIRLVLDKASTVDQAVDLLSGLDMHSVIGWAHHFAISDSSGKSVAVEWVNNKIYVSETKILTNHYVTDCPKKDNGHNAETENSNTRFTMLNKKGTASEWKMSESETAQVLKYVRAKQFNGKALTVWSAVFNPEERKITYFFRENYVNGIQIHF
ncbi:MAG: linear amide C-N hydrolase [Treponema sp.]|nr:linear amide C-N hydrolase [Treponema sp.]